MKTYIIDASVAVKWVIQEPRRAEARRFVNPDISCIAPDFIVHECLSAIQKKVARKEISEDAGWRSYTVLVQETPLILVNSSSLTQRAYQLANILHHAIYDCYYLALAEVKNVVLVTADKKFYDCVKNSDYARLIAWVEDPPKI